MGLHGIVLASIITFAVIFIAALTLYLVFYPRIARAKARALLEVKLGHEVRRIPTRLRKKSERGGPEFLLQFINPAWRATSDLQNRIWSILRTDNIKYMEAERKDTESKEHAITGTAFLVAQFFGWMEIMRRESLLLRNSGLVVYYKNVRNAFADGEDSRFQFFILEQREIGERMIVSQSDRDHGYLTMTYSDFVDLLDGENVPKSLLLLKDETKTLMTSLPKQRLVDIQDALIELMFFIDDQDEKGRDKWIPREKRRKLRLAEDDSVQEE